MSTGRKNTHAVVMEYFVLPPIPTPTGRATTAVSYTHLTLPTKA